MTLKDVTNNLQARARAKPGDTHQTQLKRGLRLALRYRRKHYTLSIAREGTYPSVAEKATLRRFFSIPTERKWRSTTKKHWKAWYVFWNPDNAVLHPLAIEKQLPIAWPQGVGPEPSAGGAPGGPT